MQTSASAWRVRRRLVGGRAAPANSAARGAGAAQRRNKTAVAQAVGSGRGRRGAAAGAPRGGAASAGRGGRLKQGGRRRAERTTSASKVNNTAGCSGTRGQRLWHKRQSGAAQTTGAAGGDGRVLTATAVGQGTGLAPSGPQVQGARPRADAVGKKQDQHNKQSTGKQKRANKMRLVQGGRGGGRTEAKAKDLR